MPLYPLPDLMLLGDHGGDWDLYQDSLYQHFVDTVVEANLTFLGLPVTCPRHPEMNGMHSSFWHLISDDVNKKRIDTERIVNIRRCECVSWIGHTIKEAQDKNGGVDCWENKRGRDTHTVLWLEQENFLVVLAKRSNYYVLKTCYKHGNGNKRKQLLKERAVNQDPR